MNSDNKRAIMLSNFKKLKTMNIKKNNKIEP